MRGDESGRSRGLCKGRWLYFPRATEPVLPTETLGRRWVCFAPTLEERRISHPESEENPAPCRWDLRWAGALSWKGRLSSRNYSPAAGRG